MKNHLANLKSLPYGGASCVLDPDLDLVVQKSIIACAKNSSINDTDIQDEFVKTYFDWIQQTKLNCFQNLDQFEILSYSNGTTEGFDKFYINNNQSRFRVFRGEYMYHCAIWKSSFPDWMYIEDAPLAKGDAVLISTPFSDTGNVHPKLLETLDICADLAVPVLIDCAFVGICGKIEIDFGHPAITDITFSLSKTFPVANLRIGMRCRRVDNDDGLLVHQKTNYTNRLACAVGLDLINQYSVDYNYEKWRDCQLQFCQKLQVTPSNSVIFGLGNDTWSAYNRGNQSNRLCFSKWYHRSHIPGND